MEVKHYPKNQRTQRYQLKSSDQLCARRHTRLAEKISLAAADYEASEALRILHGQAPVQTDRSGFG